MAAPPPAPDVGGDQNGDDSHIPAPNGAVCILCGQKNAPKKSSGQRDRTPNAPASRAVADLAQLPYDHLKGLGFCHTRCQQPARMSLKNYAELPYAPHVVALRMQIRSQVRGG